VICFNKTKNRHVANVMLAKSFKERLIGLLGRKELKSGLGILLKPCSQIHTLFMHFAIDAVFLDSDDRVLKIVTLKPYRISPWVIRSKSVLELPKGTALEVIEIGDALEFKK